jgi:hypothetical protein
MLRIGLRLTYVAKVYDYANETFQLDEGLLTYCIYGLRLVTGGCRGSRHCNDPGR